MKQRVRRPVRTLRTVLLTLTTTAAVGAGTLTASAAPYGATADTAYGTSTHGKSAYGTGAGQARRGGHEATLAALRQVVGSGELPGVIAKVHDARGAWSGAVGLSDTATGRPRLTGEHFRAASNTKMFIGTVMLQLEAEGRLSTEDTVEKWLPGLVRGNGYDGHKITLRQLLSHTSGLPDYTGDEAFHVKTSGSGFPEHRYDTYRPQDLVAVALKMAPPKANPAYSNTNYVLAGLVIEKATGHTYAQEATRRIIEPLKLTGTSFPGTDPRMPAPHPVAYSRLHSKDPDAPVHDATEQNMTWLGAAGEIISTADDLNRFQHALMRGRLLPPAQLDKMLDGAPAGGGGAYGLGVDSLKLSCGVTVYGHTGRTNGSLSATTGTKDGSHRLTFQINGDWLTNSSVYYDIIEAEFCGKAPGTGGNAGTGKFAD
ncbi:serine hydrolase domain-containing protein [Streptomyces sp. MST-110588]|uniref:serine hydrolase domain-containing protein n=1 Tax=Streptomyces sp. MST-110588 TaxID=2833628 RepID=UPI001F5C309D|nr:serine hydrolase domain-containing protein [Streptomyces sp. MST-110588]UNO39852.1 beta-lactamase family protein [Streptomyces sp. MST-110588]